MRGVYVILAITAILFLNLVTAQFGFDNPNLPRIEREDAIISGGGGAGSNVTSVVSSDGCILVNPTTGDVILTFNTSCASAGAGDITSVQGDFYITNGSNSGDVNLVFNESKLNETIDDRDSDTTYSAGANLSLVGTEFSLNATSLKEWLDTIYQAIGNYLTTTTNFGGEVSGTYNSIILNDDALDDQYIEITDLPLENQTTVYCGNVTGIDACTDSDTIFDPTNYALTNESETFNGDKFTFWSDNGFSGYPNFLIRNDNPDTVAPSLEIYKNSSSPADGDSVGGFRWSSNDEGGTKTVIAQFLGKIADVTNGDEAGIVRMLVYLDALPIEFITLDGYFGSIVGEGAIIFNNEQDKIHFQYKSESEERAIFINHSTGNIDVASNFTIANNNTYLKLGDNGQCLTGWNGSCQNTICNGNLVMSIGCLT